MKRSGSKGYISYISKDSNVGLKRPLVDLAGLGWTWVEFGRQELQFRQANGRCFCAFAPLRLNRRDPGNWCLPSHSWFNDFAFIIMWSLITGEVDSRNTT
jgi:hypothetical protein